VTAASQQHRDHDRRQQRSNQGLTAADTGARYLGTRPYEPWRNGGHGGRIAGQPGG
jgi:hypothetical protein